MSDNSIHESAISLSERVRERFKLGARERFILLFTLFSAMFCLLFVLLLQNRQLAEHIEVMEAAAIEAAATATVQRNAIAALEEIIDTLEKEIDELLHPTPTPTITPSATALEPSSPISTARATVTPTRVPLPPHGTPTPTADADAYGLTAICSISVTNCRDATGAPDGRAAEVHPGGTIILDMGAGNGITNGRGEDLAFYEWWDSSANGVFMDHVVIELSEDGNTWYQIFNWGDGYSHPMDDFSFIAAFSNDDDGEVSDEFIPSTLLYGIFPYPPRPSGILIDISFVDGSSDVVYRYVRISCPDGGVDPVQVDAVARFH